ncbi:NAD-dependent epimerase/dehydratase family protein [Rapidithrix thailandica]|uniref:NAD-dependent epimerase/dehydratase family protein n=1 Tax=Rapidithrix thailandica TaxID=413964 RepID=A0AAW9SG01_9BACT
MKILITGIAGFVGSRLAEYLTHHLEGVSIVGIDNLSRRGSETNIPFLRELGCQFVHGDIRMAEDVMELPNVDWVLDCAAIPTVMAGLQGGTSQLISNNLNGTLHLLEKCRNDNAGFTILSTSRVYSINDLVALPLQETPSRLSPQIQEGQVPQGFSERGISETFPTTAPVSLYGATKLASEVMALEYATTFGFPVWVNRCGVIAGPGQFGKIDQGIFSFWIYQWLLGKPLAYIGFGGAGKQVRDFLSPQDLGRLVVKQIQKPDHKVSKVINAGGGNSSAMSLYELSQFCKEYISPDKTLSSDPVTRPFDIPYYVTDNSLAQKYWDWTPEVKGEDVLKSILEWAVQNRKIIEKGF